MLYSTRSTLYPWSISCASLHLFLFWFQVKSHYLQQALNQDQPSWSDLAHQVQLAIFYIYYSIESSQNKG